MVEQAGDGRQIGPVFRIYGRDETIAQEPRRAEALDRGSGEKIAEIGVGKLQHVAQSRGANHLLRRQLGIAGTAGELVPRADGQAIVTAENPVAHGTAESEWNLPFVLDRIIGKA